jgi:hypothetical protein
MKIITKKEFQDWIKAQPDDRKFQFHENRNLPDLCGCPMVQFARDGNVPGWGEVDPEKSSVSDYGCGYAEWESTVSGYTTVILAKFEKDLELIDMIVDGEAAASFNYSHLKNKLVP